MSIPILSRNRGGSFAAGPAAPAAASGYDLDDSYNITTTPFIHWDASTLVAENSASDGSTFSTWTSREGSDYDLVQADAAEQFTYEATSSTMNSQPVAYSSDGARHMMTATSFLSAGTFTFPCTLISAIYYPSGASVASMWMGEDLSSTGLWKFQDYTPISSNYTCYITGKGSGPTWADGAQINIWEFDPASSSNYFYKELARTAVGENYSESLNPFNDQFALGGTTSGTYDIKTNTEIGEFIIFNEILSDTTMSGSNVNGGELFTIISYLKNKYGIS